MKVFSCLDWGRVFRTLLLVGAIVFLARGLYLVVRHSPLEDAVMAELAVSAFATAALCLVLFLLALGREQYCRFKRERFNRALESKQERQKLDELIRLDLTARAKQDKTITFVKREHGF